MHVYRASLDTLEEAIAHNELTELHGRWGGSHDILLGLLLWIHRIPVLSFHKYVLILLLTNLPTYFTLICYYMMQSSSILLLLLLLLLMAMNIFSKLADLISARVY